jgi:WD40 repeat protein
MPWAAGQIILGQYEVLGESHAGGMGVVHRVRHLGWEVDLAVKTPRGSASFPRFEAEAATWVGLGLHPHTVNCVYVRTIDAFPRVFAEWVDGGSLAEAIRGGRLDQARMLDIAIQTAWGLRHAHDSGLVHQDMKPANVMLEPDGTAKVTDFGLAVAAEHGTFGGLTPAYSSPEQAAAANGDRSGRLTSATDVWSWAITVAEMFAGRRITRFGQAAAEALENVRESLPPEIADLLAGCFADRPDSFAGLVEQLITRYADLTGEPYPRPAPRPALLRSDGLSNQALSLLDLGRVEEAENLWRDAVSADPHHLPSVYNFGLHRWRAGLITGEEVVSALEAARTAGGDTEPGRGALLLGNVELERHEDERAGELLREAAAAGPAAAEAVAALAERASRAPQVRAETLAGEVRAVAAGPAGEHVLFGLHGGGLYLWSPTGGEPRALTRGAEVTAIALDATGRLGAVLREDGSITLWDVADGAPRGWQRNASGATSVAVSGDGRYVAAGHRSGLIQIWEPGAAGEPVVLTGHTGRVTSLALSRTGRRAVSASFGGNVTSDDGDGTVRHWAVRTGECVAVWTGPRRGTLASGAPWTHFSGDMVAVTADARYAVAAWEDGPLVVWDARRAAAVTTVSHRLRYEIIMALAPDARGLLVGGPSRSVQILDARDGRSLRTLDDDLPELLIGVNAGAISTDGSVVVLGGPYQVVLRSMPGSDYRAPWCYARPRPAAELHRAEESFDDLLARARTLVEGQRLGEAAALLRSARDVPGYARHPELLAAWRSLLPHGRRAGLIAAWELYRLDGRDVFTQPPTIALRRDGLAMATGRWTGHVDLWDLPVARKAGTFEHRLSAKAREMRWTRCGNLLVVLTWDGTVDVLDIRDGRSEVIAGESGRITAFDLDRSGERILYGDESGMLRMRGLATGVRLTATRACDGPVAAVAISPDARRMVCLDERGEIRMWRPNGRRPDWKRRLGIWHDTRLHFTPDKSVVLLDEPMVLTGLDAAGGRKRYSFRSRRPAMTGRTNVAFTADRRLAATPDLSKLVVWETSTGKVRHELSLPDDPHIFVLGPDGTFAVVAGATDTVGIWDLATGRCLRTMEGHRTRLHVMQLDDDGALLVTADLGGGLRAWELAWEADVE